MNDAKYIGLDVHQATISVAILDSAGKLVMEAILETTYGSGEYRFVGSQLQRSKKFLAIRGLNLNHNHDLKNIFKGAATWAAANSGPFQNFYEACLARGMKPSMARLTLARKSAAITLLVWKKGVRFDAEHLKPQAA